MAQRRVYKLYKPKTQDELVQQLNNLFTDLGEFIARAEGVDGQSLAHQSPVSFNGQRLVDLDRPLDPNDAVRLQDLWSLQNDVEKKISISGDDSSGFGTTTQTQTGPGAILFGVGFDTVFDGFTNVLVPSTLPDLDAAGRPRGHLVYRDAPIRYTTDVLPEPGLWTWDESLTAVRLHLSQAPIQNDYLEFAVVISR